MSQVPDTSDRPFFLKTNFADAEQRLYELLRRLPPSDEEDLRVDELQTLVYETVPELSEVAQKIAQLLRHGVHEIVVQKLPFSGVGLESSKLVLLAFASCIGEPSAVDPYSRKRVWEVSPRVGPGPGYIPTITEHNYGADLHTDSSFKLTPEQYVLFFAFHPAEDGGGVSTLLSKDQLLTRLSETDEGKECARLLSTTEFPFRVPTVFTKRKSESEMEWIMAPILSSQSRIRFRHDLISSALERIPIKLSSEAEWALSYFVQILHECSPLSLALGQDELLVTNNYVVLHGRTAFEDLDRTLLRVRLFTTH
jgi:Taurine catabolism dioxygenase TauD, TfdA family